MKTESTVIKSKAVLSDNGEHRFLLSKEWDSKGESALVIMINPNSADTVNADLTTTLVINNAYKLGFGCVNIVNLYSRITDKISFRFNSDEDLLDDNNDKIIEQYAEKSDAIIIAWGSVGIHSQRVRERQLELLNKLSKYRNRLYKIGENGYHPLTPAVRGGWELETFEIEEVYNG